MNAFEPGAPAEVILDRREAAIRRIAQRKHRTFKLYAGIMVAANVLIVALWAALALAGRLDSVIVYVWPGQPPLPSGFFWPIFPLAICGVLVLLSARRAYPSTGYPEREIEQEMTRAGTSGPPSGERRAEPAKPATGPGSPDTEDAKPLHEGC